MIEAVNSDIRRQEYRLMAQLCPTLGPLVGSALELFDGKPASGWSFYVLRRDPDRARRPLLEGEVRRGAACAALALRGRSGWLACPPCDALWETDAASNGKAQPLDEEAVERWGIDPEELTGFLEFLGIERLTTPGPGPLGWPSRPLARMGAGPALCCPPSPAGLTLETAAPVGEVADLVMAGREPDARDDFYAEACARRNHGLGRFWLARLPNGRAAATVSAWAVWDGQAYMAMGLTAPDLRGRGYSGWLIPAMAKSLLGEGLTPTFLCREALLPFYRRQGMVQIGEYRQYYTESSELDVE